MSTGKSERGGAWSRRVFLRVSALGVAATAVGTAFWFTRDAPDRLGGDSADSGGAGALESEDFADLVALAEVLHPPDNDRERRELAATVRWWATGRTNRGPHRPVYRDGLRSLDHALVRAGHDLQFHRLSLADREAMVAALFRPGDAGPFQALAVELLEGIYASAPGWRVVGYSTWPGVASALLEYTRKPAEPVGGVAAAARQRTTVGRLARLGARAPA